jgi:hypothetical protein
MGEYEEDSVQLAVLGDYWIGAGGGVHSRRLRDLSEAGRGLVWGIGLRRGILEKLVLGMRGRRGHLFARFFACLSEFKDRL